MLRFLLLIQEELFGGWRIICSQYNAQIRKQRMGWYFLTTPDCFPLNSVFPLVAIFQLVSHHDNSWSKTLFAFKVLMHNIPETPI